MKWEESRQHVVRRQEESALSLHKLDLPRWHAVYTRPRAERKVAERLQQGGIASYCPTYTSLRQWSDRRKKVVLPVFVSYVFVQLRKKDSSTVLKDPGVLHFVYHLGKPAIIPERDMMRLRRFLGDLDEGEQLSVRPIQPGDRVSIQYGPLAGLEGQVKDRTRHKAFVVLEPLGVVVEVENKLITRLGA